MKIVTDGLTFDDVLLEPRYSDLLPNDASTDVKLGKLSLSIPLISSPMDTVTESNMAIAIAQIGGLGVIHRNMEIDTQVKEIERVKKFETWIVHDPITVNPDQTLRSLLKTMEKHKISGVPVVDKDKTLLGIITHRDIKFVNDKNAQVKDVMTKEELVTASWPVDQKKALSLLRKHRLEKLIIVGKDGKCEGLVTYRGLHQASLYPNSSKDAQGSFIVGGAVGVGEKELERADALVAAGVDALFIDTAHGHSKGVLDSLKSLRKKYKDLVIVAGNVVTKEGTKALISAGASAIKVGVGPGSICTTRIVAGVGVPQLTAISQCASVSKVPIIADGGIRFSGDLAKAIAVGGDMVMIGSLLAGTDEAPGEVFLQNSKPYKAYRGMGSVGALSNGFSSDRYNQDGNKETERFVPEGVEAQVPYKGSALNVVYQLIGGLRSAMGYLGSPNIKSMQKNSKLVRITDNGMKESHVHDIHVTRQAPNYPFLFKK